MLAIKHWTFFFLQTFDGNFVNWFSEQVKSVKVLGVPFFLRAPIKENVAACYWFTWVKSAKSAQTRPINELKKFNTANRLRVVGKLIFVMAKGRNTDHTC